jgi:hypothetical protein
MQTPRTAVLAVALAALAGSGSALAGCSSSAKPAAAPAPAAATPEPSASLDAGTLDATSAYLTALGRVDKKLVADTRAALDNGMEVCVDVDERRPDAEQEKNVASRFAVDAAQAKQILALTKANLCLE